MIRYAIIGCGVVGAKRAAAMRPGQLALCVDMDIERAIALAASHPGARAKCSLDGDDFDAVIVATPNRLLCECAMIALGRGKPVLVEKPGALTSAQLCQMAMVDAPLRVGYNHRFHPGVVQAKAIMDSGVMGAPMMLRARYGHGGRRGYEKEWRGQHGAGELMDQGVHLIDLSIHFLGLCTGAAGHLETLFWDMPVDDNAFMRLSHGRAVSWLHASCTEWKNMFSLEIYGSMGKVVVDGLGGSYGVERCTQYLMPPEMGVPSEVSWTFPGPDSSWRLELDEFELDIKEGRRPIRDSIHVLEVVESIRTSR